MCSYHIKYFVRCKAEKHKYHCYFYNNIQKKDLNYKSGSHDIPYISVESFTIKLSYE